MGQSTVQAGVTRWRLSGGSRAGGLQGPGEGLHVGCEAPAPGAVELIASQD